MEIGEIAQNEQFLLFPLCFLPSFCDGVSYPLGELICIFIKFKTVICKLFQFGRAQKLSYWKELSNICPVNCEELFFRCKIIDWFIFTWLKVFRIITDFRTFAGCRAGFPNLVNLLRKFGGGGVLSPKFAIKNPPDIIIWYSCACSQLNR